MRRAAKVDANHEQIVSALRAAGAMVQSLAALGKGVPDLLVGFRYRLYLMEVKDGTKAPSKRRLTTEQLEWQKEWAGYPYAVVHSPEEALEAIQFVRWNDHMLISDNGQEREYKAGM